MDPINDEEEKWCHERREQVIDYLSRQNTSFGEVGEVPAWFEVPNVSIWAIESLKSPGDVGWWAICGDLPTDYCSSQGCRHPRDAMRRFADNWISEIGKTLPGAEMIGDLKLPAELVPLLKSRANLLLSIASESDARTEHFEQ